MLPTFVAETKKTSATSVADISPTFFNGRPITASVIEVSHAHPPSTSPLGVFWLTGRRQKFLSAKFATNTADKMSASMNRGLLGSSRLSESATSSVQLTWRTWVCAKRSGSVIRRISGSWSLFCLRRQDSRLEARRRDDVRWLDVGISASSFSKSSWGRLHAHTSKVTKCNNAQLRVRGFAACFKSVSLFTAEEPLTKSRMVTFW